MVCAISMRVLEQKCLEKLMDIAHTASKQRNVSAVIPAQAGIQFFAYRRVVWIPAFAGTTVRSHVLQRF
jgi:hypothetical protein